MSAHQADGPRWVIVTPNLSKGAFSKITAALSAELARREVSVTVLYMEQHGAPIAIDDRVRVEAINGRARNSASQIASCLRKKRPDVLLSISFLVNVPSLLASGLSRYQGKVLLSEQTLPTRDGIVDYPGGFSRGVLRLVYSSVYRRADAIGCVSRSVEEAIADLTVSNSVRQNLSVVPNPIESVRTTPSPQPDSDRGLQREPVFLTVGRLVPRKRIDLAIAGLAAFVEHSSAGQLLIAGEGPEGKTLVQLTKDLGVEDRVHFLGYVEDVGRHMGEATALLHLAHSEAFGMVIGEALSNGLPVLVTEDSGGPKELIGDAGLVIKPEAREVSVAMGELWGDGARLQAMRADAILAARPFSPVSVIDKWMALAKAEELRE